jgi:integrase
MRRRIDTPEFNGPFAPMCEAFVRQRRALGIQYNGQIWILRRFDNFAKDFDIQNFAISRELAGAWMEKSPNESDSYHANRLYAIWHFADFLVQQGYDSYFKRFKLRRNSAHVPYIFTKNEISKIFAVLDTMDFSPSSSNKHKSFPVLYRMLYGCGLRISEALHLTVKDVDIQNSMIHIPSGKNDKERLVPMSKSLVQWCSAYLDETHAGHNESHMFFYSRDGKPYSVSNIEKHFRTLLWNADIPYCGRNLGPRLHDVRHTFVCHRLNEWASSGFDLMAGLPVLSKYLGHENVAGTQWYLKMTAEAYPDVTEKMNALTGYVFPEFGGDYLEEI